GQDFDHFLNENILESLINSSIKRQDKLSSILSFHKLFYESQTVVPNFSTMNEGSNLWSACRNVRRSLYTTMSLYGCIKLGFVSVSLNFLHSRVDECESILNESQNSDLNSEIKSV